MRRMLFFPMILFLIGVNLSQTYAQVSTSSNLVAQPIPDRIVPFDIADPGISKQVEFGADLAWANEQAFRRNILFMGLDQIDIVRASFQPTYPLIGDTALTQAQIDDLNYRLWLINTYVGPNTDLALNCDHPWVDEWYVGYPERWEKLIEISTRAFNDAGHNVVTVGAFNEPDYGWGQGTDVDMYNITALLNANPYFNGVRLSGGNTLNNDAAQWWYDMLIPAGVTEGNTHQLAGGFDTYASFIQSVRANGHHATLDELHNIGEALVGYEYGMQTGIWWADIDLASGEMVKAFDGERLGYAEHRDNWTSAAVYRAPDGKVQAFGGTSERQAVTTSFNYVSKDRVVYFDGHGPQREFVLEMPGGTGYMTGQTNAERVINITWGEDVQPAIQGTYMLVNRNSGLVLQVPDGASPNTNTDGANVNQGSYAGNEYQQWTVTPVDSRVGGDFSYYWISPVSNSSMSLELAGYSLDNGANIEQWTTTDSYGGNTQWYLDYAEDGWFYIRSRESSKCLDIWGAGTTEGDNACQWEKNGGANQQWRFIPVGAPIEFVAPSAPTNLSATAQPASVKLNWTASPEGDVAGYSIFRAESAGGAYNTIARDVTTTSFVDNTALAGVTYYYKVKAVDNSLNRSAYSNEVSAGATGTAALIANYNFDGNTDDNTINLNNCATYGGTSFVTGQVGSNAISLNGTDAFVQLPADIASHDQITVAAWVYYNGGAQWQRVFDFGNGTDEYMFLTPNSWTGGVQFGLKYNGTEENLYGPTVAVGEWTHIAITLGANGAALYVNGVIEDSNSSYAIRPNDFKPIQNYIGRSQYPDALLNGFVDDFRVYNYELTSTEISDLQVPCDPSVLTPYYQVNYGAWVIGTDITINEGDVVGFGPQPLTGGSWSWTGCGTTGTSREQFVTLTSSCAATATYTNDCGAVSNVTYNVTVNPIAANYITVQSIVTGTASAPQGKSYGTAAVTIVDDLQNPIANATVTGTFSGSFNETVSGVTGADGTVYFQTSSYTRKPTVDFCVDDVTHSSLTYDPALNQVTCSTELRKAVLTDVHAKTGEDFGISVYPNPVETVLNVKVENFTGNVSINIFSVDGRLLKQVNREVSNNGIISIPDWGYNGLTFVKISTKNENEIFKVDF